MNNVHKQFANFFPSKVARPFLYLLSKKLQEGHICVDLDSVSDDEFDKTMDAPQTIEELKKDSLVSDGSTKQPIVLNGNRIYLERFFFYETKIVEWVNNRAASEQKEIEKYITALRDHNDYVQTLFKKSDEAIDWQAIACISAVLNSFTIITGGPGTGKTTTVAKILEILLKINPNLKIALAAPTGKAAARMDESLKTAAAGNSDLTDKFNELQPFTIHRLLGTNAHSIYFKHHADHTLNYDIIVADEASMIDASLFYKFLTAVGPDTKLIMLGDRNQLSSVEAGSIFGDFCLAQNDLNIFSEERKQIIEEIFPKISLPTSKELNELQHPLFQRVIELKKSYRFSDAKGIGKLCRAIIQNDAETMKHFFENNDPEIFLDPNYSGKTFKDFINGFKEYIGEKDIKQALQKLNELKVLVAVREGKQGLHEINLAIEKYLTGKKWIKKDGEFYENRPVMVTSNNPELEIFNGDVGIVRIDKNGEKKIWFEIKGELKGFAPASIAPLETVYAMTIHKSQGSEFEKVLVVLPQNQNVKILTRELLYTAASRAKKHVIIQGTEEHILKIMELKVKRSSGIKERFQLK